MSRKQKKGKKALKRITIAISTDERTIKEFQSDSFIQKAEAIKFYFLVVHIYAMESLLYILYKELRKNM